MLRYNCIIKIKMEMVMKKILTLILILNSLLLASSNENERKDRIEKQIKKEIENEKMYAKKKYFYIDLKGAEINEESLKSIPEIEVDDLDMDSVYD